jgi:DNA-binding MarR family transcriptional regulator
MTHPSLADADALRAWRDRTLYRLLLRASRAERAATLRQLQEQGYADVSLGDTNLLANLDTEGTTVTALARRAGVTRQAASQQVAALESAGYVERRPSETDGRAVVVVQTARGRALLAEALDVVEALEAEYAAVLGPRRLAALKSSLTALLERIDPEGALGRD